MIGWKRCHQPIKNRVWKSLLTNMDVNMGVLGPAYSIKGCIQRKIPYKLMQWTRLYVTFRGDVITSFGAIHSLAHGRLKKIDK